MAQSPITTPNAVCLDVTTGAVEWSKNADALDVECASVTKAFTAHHILADDLLPGLTQTVTFYDPSGTPGTGTALGSGDTATAADFINASMIYSDNRATEAVALASIGYGSSSLSRLPDYVAAMADHYATEHGWGSATFDSATGLGDTYVSARMVAELGRTIATDQPWLLTVMGTASKTVTVGGPNARTVTMGYLAAPVKAAVEAGGGTWLGSKSGTASGPTSYSQVILWGDPDGGRHSLGLIGAPSTLARDNDITTIVSDVITAAGGSDPDPDPPAPSGLLDTDGNPVTLYRTDGTPATISS